MRSDRRTDTTTWPSVARRRHHAEAHHRTAERTRQPGDPPVRPPLHLTARQRLTLHQQLDHILAANGCQWCLTDDLAVWARRLPTQVERMRQATYAAGRTDLFNELGLPTDPEADAQQHPSDRAA